MHPRLNSSASAHLGCHYCVRCQTCFLYMYCYLAYGLISSLCSTTSGIHVRSSCAACCCSAACNDTSCCSSCTACSAADAAGLVVNGVIFGDGESTATASSTNFYRLQIP